MDEFYKISSTERVQQLEKELAAQLAELKTEIEDNGVLQGTPDRSYSSVPIPKDASYFRKEREVILKKGLQVAEAKPLVVQADVMQRELESCLKRENTAESLPLLLHQFFTDRITHLVQSKYLHMLRWKRFCRHSSVIEQLYPLYQVGNQKIEILHMDPQQCRVKLKELRQAYQRSREANGHSGSEPQTCRLYDELHALLGGVPTTTAVLCVDSINGLSHNRDADFGDEEDEEEEVEAQQASGETIFPDSQELFFTPDLVPSQPTEGRLLDLEGPLGKDDVFTLPQHTTETEELKPQLQLLLSYFGVCYDTENLKNSANEMELFSVVIQKFRSVFSKQQTMRTFPVYDAGVPGSENWDILGPSMVLKKRANWIPFIKIKPKQDPWQQKLLTKLKQWKKVDELLHLQSKFLEVSDMEQVIDVLQEHATEVL
ncbi:unnamed protein product [Eretmochelys imbricata]